MANAIQVPDSLIKPTVALIGEDGNAFAVMGNVKRALKDAGNSPEVIKAYTDQAMSGSYDHLLAVTTSFAEVV